LENNGCLPNQEKENYSQAEKAWDKLQAKKWRLINTDANYELEISLSPYDKDIKKLVRNTIIDFFNSKDGDEGKIFDIQIRLGFIIVYLDKKQKESGCSFDWRICKLPNNWDHAVEKPDKLILEFKRYEI
jgi:hypothetical protein